MRRGKSAGMVFGVNDSETSRTEPGLVELAKVRAGEQRIAPADKVAAHLEAGLGGRFLGIIHAPSMPALFPRRILFLAKQPGLQPKRGGCLG